MTNNPKEYTMPDPTGPPHRKIITPGQVGEIVKPGAQPAAPCPMCAELRQAVDHARDCGNEAIKAAVIAKQAAETAQEHQVKMKDMLVQYMTLVYEVAAFPAPGQPDIEPEPGTLAAKARALILASA